MPAVRVLDSGALSPREQPVSEAWGGSLPGFSLGRFALFAACPALPSRPGRRSGGVVPPLPVFFSSLGCLPDCRRFLLSVG